MDNQIDKDDFKNPYFVLATSAGAITFLNELIAEHQEEYLTQILGYRLYREMEDNLTDTLWAEFLTGKTYTEDGVKYVYKGFKHILCRFIYFHWHQTKDSNLVEDGEQKLQYEEGMKIIPEYKMQKQFNAAIEYIQSEQNYFPSVYHYLDTLLTGNDSLIWEFIPFDEGTNSIGI